jgi:uncharacterized protein
MELSTTPPNEGAPASRQMRSLDPAIRAVWSLKFLMLFGVIFVVAAIYDVTGLFNAGRALPPGAVSGLTILVGGLVTFFIPRLRYRFWKFDLRKEELLLERGILNRVRTVVPLRRIQHLDVSQDILEREFDLGKLIVHTAGTRSSDVVLPGLRYEEAERLREEMKHYILEDTL